MRIGLKIYNTDWLYMFNVVRLAPTSPDQATCPNGIKPDGPIVNASGHSEVAVGHPSLEAEGALHPLITASTASVFAEISLELCPYPARESDALHAQHQTAPGLEGAHRRAVRTRGRHAMISARGRHGKI